MSQHGERQNLPNSLVVTGQVPHFNMIGISCRELIISVSYDLFKR
jgi:hypothetical protein